MEMPALVSGVSPIFLSFFLWKVGSANSLYDFELSGKIYAEYATFKPRG